MRSIMGEGGGMTRDRDCGLSLGNANVKVSQQAYSKPMSLYVTRSSSPPRGSGIWSEKRNLPTRITVAAALRLLVTKGWSVMAATTVTFRLAPLPTGKPLASLTQDAPSMHYGRPAFLRLTR